MKLHIWPKTDLGKISSLLGLVFVILLALSGVPIPDVFSGMLSFVGSLIGVAAFCKRDNSLFVLFSILTGIYSLGCGISNLLYI